jgi:hypothetical protein
MVSNTRKKLILNLHVGDDIEVDAINGNASRSLAMRNITRQLEKYFNERQVHYEKP